jgi:hypothetical protein
MSITASLTTIHNHHFPNAPASESMLEQFERSLGWNFDADLRAFYLNSDGARLFSRFDSAYNILPLQGIERARTAVFGSDSDDYGSPFLYVICDVQDGNYSAVDVSCPTNGFYPLFDVFHETIATRDFCKMVAGSFSEFLERALESNNHLYWLR